MTREVFMLYRYIQFTKKDYLTKKNYSRWMSSFLTLLCLFDFVKRWSMLFKPKSKCFLIGWVWYSLLTSCCMMQIVGSNDQSWWQALSENLHELRASVSSEINNLNSRYFVPHSILIHSFSTVNIRFFPLSLLNLHFGLFPASTFMVLILGSLLN